MPLPGYDFPSYEVVNHLIPAMPIADVGAALAGRPPQCLRRGVVHGRARRDCGASIPSSSGWPTCPIRVAVRWWKPLRAGRIGVEWDARDSVGHGIGYARYKGSSAYCAVVAEVEAVEQVRVRRLTIAVDAGLVISPDGAANQIEGGAIQATSWTLKERVRFDRYNVTSDNWETYPILRFSEVPAVDVELVPGDGNPPLGVGECAQGPTTAAIANAVYDAIGRARAIAPLDPGADRRRDAVGAVRDSIKPGRSNRPRPKRPCSPAALSPDPWRPCRRG